MKNTVFTSGSVNSTTIRGGMGKDLYFIYC